MKSHIKSVSEKKHGKIPCYYIPKSFLTDKKLINYSIDSKLLAGIMLSMANRGEDVIETAKLINNLGTDYINKIILELKEEAER